MNRKAKHLTKSAFSLILAMCMLFSCVIQTGAAQVQSESVGALSVAGKIYFIKPDDWSYAALAIGHSSYSDCYQMSNISGTKLYYVKRDSAWSDSTEFAFLDVNGWGSEGNSVTHRAAYASHASTVNSTYAMNAGSTYLIPTTANSPTYYSAGYSAMNATLTVKTMLKSGSSYAETSTKCGDFSAANAKKLSGDGASAALSISQTNGTATLTTARTNTATISQSVVSGYTFKGWKTSKDTTGSGLSTGDYSFTNAGSAATVYAYYTASSNPAADSVTLTQSPASGTIYSGETSVTYTASATNPKSGVTYNFKVNGTSVQNTSSTTYTRTYSSAGTYGVTVTVEKSSYDSVTSSEVSTTVTDRPSVYVVGGFRPGGWSGNDANKMTYNSTDDCYYVEQDLNSTYSYPQNGEWGFGVMVNTTLYKNSGTMSSANCTNWTFSTSAQNCGITPSVTGTYIFKVKLDNGTPKVSLLYPHTVTFNSKGGSTVASQVVKYNGKATKPADPTKSGYTFGGWMTTDGGSTAFNFTSTAITADTTVYAKWTSLPALTAPSITYNSSSATTQTVTAAQGQKARISWSAVANAGSYEVYKDGSLVTTVTTTYYDIERGNSYGGNYTVKAVPSNASSSSYITSADSNGINFTFSKVALPVPSVSISPTSIAAGDSVTAEFLNYSSLSSYITNGYATLTRGTRAYQATGGAFTTNTAVTSTSGSETLSPTSSIQYAYYMAVTTAGSDYYSQSGNSAFTDVAVYTPAYYLVGDLVDSTNNKWNTSLKDYPVDEYVSANVFKRTVTFATGGNNDKHYFRLNNGTNQYTVTNGTDTDMSTHTTSATAVTASAATTNGSMYVTGQGTFTIYVNQATSGSPKVWVVKIEAQKYTTIVYVNKDSGATNLYVWKDANNAVSAWPGEDITGTTETVNDIEYYKYTFESYWDHFDIVPNKGNGNNQSADITNIAASKTYYVVWDGGNNTTASISETAPVIQLGYKVQNSSNDNHENFSNRSVSVNLAANTTYEFWLKSANSHLNDQNSGTMTRGNCTNWSFPVNSTNTKIQADIAGTYTFTYSVSNGNFSVSVTYPPEPKYNVTVNQGDHGTVKVNGNNFTSGSTIQIGSITTASIQAVAVSGYHFKSWTTSGGVAAVSGYTTSSNPITISASAAGTITATYEEDSYTLTLNSGGNGSITTPASKTLTVHPFTATSLSGVTVTPSNGYKFNGWTKGTGVTLTNGSSTNPASGTVTASQSSTLTANFVKISYTLTGKTALDGNEGNYGTVKFYSNQDCTTQITTAQIGDTVYAKFSSNDYALVGFTLLGIDSDTVSTTGNVLKFTMGYADTTVTANVRELRSVTYYVDMHNNDMTGKTVEVAIVTDGSGTVVLKDGNDQDCKATLVQQGNSTVYAATIPTSVTKIGTSYGINLRVNYTGYPQWKIVSLDSAQATALMNASSPEVWIEALNEAYTYKITYASNVTPAVESGKKRIYVAKPHGWQDTTEPSWKNLHLYHWGDYQDIGWNNAPEMIDIGDDGEYHYYYFDVDSGVNNIIFQGWKDNSNTPDVQTGNIENIGSANYFVLSKDGGAYFGTKGENVNVPGYTRYVQNVYMNVGETANIVPVHTGAVVTYTSTSDNPNITVSSEGVIYASASATGTVTVRVFGTLGARVASPVADYMEYTVSVYVRNPGIISKFELMSFDHQEYTVTIPVPEGSSDQPGYFVLDNTSVIVNGLYDGLTYTAKYSNSAIITETETVTVDNSQKTKTFTVKYAAPNASLGYSSIALNDATIVTMSIRKTGEKRFGFKKWNPSQQSVTSSKVINNGVETVTHKGLAFVSGTSTYQAVFEKYDYVDVTFIFHYDEYVPQVVSEKEMINGVETVVRRITNYQYDPTWAANTNAHTRKEYTVSGYEVRNLTTGTITSENLKEPAASAISVLPSNDYYNYNIQSSGITIDSKGSYVATVIVNLTKTVRKYSVYLNGSLVGNDYTYQAYADLNTGNTVSKWYAVKKNAAIDANSPLLATGTGYKFRVKGDTYLSTQEGTLADDGFNRSENGFANYEVTHKADAQQIMKEYLLQNFYIADFFDKEKVMDKARGFDENHELTKTDEANFVGGGVVYFSMTNNEPYSKAVDAGYVNADGTINANEVKAMLKRNIEARYSSTLAGEIGEEDAMKVAYGQEIAVTNNEENGVKTGVLYRYLPLENYAVDNNNNITTTLNSDVFRYSNSLQSYQYIYASGNENKASNNGKNMRLYSYYIYSYRTYDKETNLPKLIYEVVLSDQYSDASTYWAGNSNS